MDISPDCLEWVAKAEEDRRAAELLHASGDATFGAIICFHCQQSAEKYLKAALVQARVDFPKTHDFGELVILCKTVAADFERLKPPTSLLQKYAVDPRCPGFAPDAATVTAAMDAMREVRTFCRGHLGLEES